MINGKFFCGLTDKMMDKKTGPNRQKSNFFWPDEANEDIKTKSSENQPVSQNLNEVDPKLLSKRELSSKIKFYDSEEDGSKVNGSKNMYHKNNNKFTSNIKFNDCSNDSTYLTSGNKDYNSKNEKSNNCENISKKRISFMENNVSEGHLPKNVLKNNKQKILYENGNGINTHTFSSESFTKTQNVTNFGDEKKEKKIHELRKIKAANESDFTVINNTEAATNGTKRTIHVKVHSPDTFNEYNKSFKNVYHEKNIDSNLAELFLNDSKNEKMQNSHCKELKGDEFVSQNARIKQEKGFNKHDEYLINCKPYNSSQNCSRITNNIESPTSKRKDYSGTHKHLQSNIIFNMDGDDNKNISNSRRIRNVAVSRVSVGLPD